ncbi:MAG: hypothetical protein HETSPECPRED_002549 [Heterodermia speciosa]|uniref:Splicing factor YJU2 n=1 Tax=Heterodermia speciosa TaxID=116794 RepID=A0A8H3IJ82_9LECA|nr:MAG: hypothetical protein HETSPECPRED_002549 [Heterodermia speciosa]
MSERKVLTKYYPPDFDPSKIARTRGPKPAGPKVQTVRLMAPFSMKCTSCGEYIYKGRKFNARKETTDEKYLNIPIFRFYIRCTRCSGEITFKTDPKNMDYQCEKGAKRNFEVWRQNPGEGNGEEMETDQERLDRLEAEEAEMGVMENLETKVVDAKREMEIADALDEIRTRNARNERAGKKADVADLAQRAEEEKELERKRIEQEDDEAARRAFTSEDGERVRKLSDEEGPKELAERASITLGETAAEMMPPPTFKRAPKKKRDLGAALGIKKKASLV